MSVEEYIRNASPHFFALCDTGPDSRNTTGNIFSPDYFSIITKHDPLHRHVHGLDVHVNEGFPCGRADSPYMGAA